MFEQTRNQGVHIAPEANSARQQMKIRTASFLLKSDLLFGNESDCGNCVERSPQKNWAQCSTQWSSAQYLRTNIEPNYHPAPETRPESEDEREAARLKLDHQQALLDLEYDRLKGEIEMNYRRNPPDGDKVTEATVAAVVKSNARRDHSRLGAN